MKKKLFIVFALLLVVSICGFAAEQAKSEPKYGGSLRFSVHRDVGGFDPHVAWGITSCYIQGNIYDTLFEFDEEGKFRAALAESWGQPDDRTYVFKLRKGVKFHDGTDFDAQDVIASIKRIQDPKTIAAALKGAMDNVESIEAPDPFTVKLKLKNVDPTFLYSLASYCGFIVSADDVKNGFDFAKKTNGTGAFILDSWEPQRQYVLKKNLNYWKKGLPYLDQIVMTPILATASRMNSLRAGEADMVDYVPWEEINRLELEEFDVWKDYGSFNYIRLNVGTPPLDNKKVRQALNYIIDREAMSELAWGGLATIIDGPLQPKGPYYFKELEGYYKKDWDKAKQLLKEAGYNSPADVPALEIATIDTAVVSDTGKVALQQFKEFGLKVGWKTHDAATHTRNRAEGTYTMQQDGAAYAGPDPDAYRSIFHSKEGSVYALGVKYKNEKLDELLEKGAVTIDENERRKIYLEVEKIILDDAPFVFELWRPQATATAKYLKGFVSLPDALSLYSFSRFEYIWLEK